MRSFMLDTLMRRLCVCVQSALLCVLVASIAPAVSADDLRVGTAKAEFELPYGMPLAGYSRRRGRPNQGTHDPVGVRALAVQGATGAVVIASCDLLIIDEDIARLVKERARQEGLAENFHLLLAATHTHSGPGAYGKRFAEKVSMGHYEPEAADAIIRTIATTVARAATTLAPAQMAVRSGRTEGLVKNRAQEDGFADDELTLAAFYPIETMTVHDSVVAAAPEQAQFVSTQSPIAVLMNFSAHPTALGASNYQFSGDYPGVLMREIESRFPSATCLFLAGAVADQAPVKEGDGFEPAEHLGQELAARASQMLENMRPEPVASVRVSRRLHPLDRPDVRLGGFRLFGWLSRALVDDDATLTAISIGRLILAGVPCDLAASLGDRIKQAARASGLDPMIVGFADDYIGYCLPREAYADKSYETSMAFNGPDTGERITRALIEMIHETNPQ